MGGWVFHQVVDLALRGQYLGLRLLLINAAIDGANHVLSQTSWASIKPLVQPGSLIQFHFSLRFLLIKNTSLWFSCERILANKEVSLGRGRQSLR